MGTERDEVAVVLPAGERDRVRVVGPEQVIVGDEAQVGHITLLQVVQHFPGDVAPGLPHDDDVGMHCPSKVITR